MSHLIHTIEVNGQVLTRKTDGYTVYAYAVPKSGRKIEAIRATLQSIIDAPEKEAARWAAAGIELDVADRVKAAKRAKRELARIADIPAGTFVWEKASWHADFQLALKAARGNRALVKTAVVAEA
jgi:hypothetical protein